MLRTTLLAVAVSLGSAMPAAAVAAPPPNDNYLASLRINDPLDGDLPTQFSDAIDTTEATTQADIHDPNRDGLPLGGAPPEPTACPVGGPTYGKTAWYDFVPPVPGGVEITATGFDAVIAVYEWDPVSSRITRTLTCQNATGAPVETVRLQGRIEARANYTIQLGGFDPTGGLPDDAAAGPLQLSFLYFRDGDGDGTLDEEPDKCRHLPGIPAFGGCPPVVSGGPRILFDRPGGGIEVTSLAVDRVDPGSIVVARCARNCGRSVRLKARRRGTLELAGFDGRVVDAGDRIVVRIMHPKARRGRYRHGAFAKVFTWPVLRDGLGPRVERCVAPGSDDKRRCP